MVCIFAFFSIKGFCKGFLSTLFSLFGVVFISYVSYLLTDSVVEIIKEVDVFNFGLFNVIKSALDSLLPGEYHSVDEMLVMLDSSKVNGILLFVLKLVAKNIIVDGAFSFGEVFAPIFYNYLLKVVAFILVFIVLMIAVKVFKWVASFIISKSGLSVADRVLGATVGLLKGFVFFGVVYCVLFFLASFTASEVLREFFESGRGSNLLYGFVLRYLI